MPGTESEAAAKAAPQFDEAMDTGLNLVEGLVAANAEAARNGFETAVAAGREAMGAACKAGGEVKGLETAGDLPQAGFEAMAQAGAAFAKGIQGLNGRMFEIARARLAEGAQARKALFGAQTFQEAVDIQRDYVKASFDRAVHDGIEVSNAWVRLAGEAGAPIGRCVSDAIAEGARKAA